MSSCAHIRRPHITQKRRHVFSGWPGAAVKRRPAAHGRIALLMLLVLMQVQQLVGWRVIRNVQLLTALLELRLVRDDAEWWKGALHP